MSKKKNVFNACNSLHKQTALKCGNYPRTKNRKEFGNKILKIHKTIKNQLFELFNTKLQIINY